jgi:DNA (cytosine-5)-methyltransferase 1
VVILDLFAGPGGWDEGLKMLGRDDVLGIEWDKDACATAEAAGHTRLYADVTEVVISDLRDVTGLIASPPCQTFSAAGKQEGRASLDDLLRALSDVSEGVEPSVAVARRGMDDADPRSNLILQPMRFIRGLRPAWIAFEEVKEALPVWEAYAALLPDWGYSVWTGVLNAADYGVPQKRKRAFLLATRNGTARPPEPTHSERDEWALFDQREPWVTMADALGWDADDCRAANALAPEPARDPERALWPLWRPATTIVRSFRPDIVASPGYRQAGDGPRQNQPGSLYVTPEQMAVLQGVRPDYPFTAAGATKRLSLIGAMLPPPWAAAILEPLLAAGSGTCVECGNDDATYMHDRCSDCLEAAA